MKKAHAIPVVGTIEKRQLSKLKRNFTDVEESGELDFSFNEEIKENPNNDDSAALKTIPQVDGKLLSENETLFEEYLCKEFDEEQWLKQSKIRF